MRTAYVYNFLIEANLMASMAILLMLPARRLLRRQLGNRALCFAWALIAIRLLCPLALPNPVLSAFRPPAVDEAIRPIAGQVKTRLEGAMRIAQNLALGRNGWNWNAPAVARLIDLQDAMANGSFSARIIRIYLLGFAAVTGWFIAANARFRRRLKADRIEALSGELLKRYQALCAERGVKPLPVYFVDPLPGACLVGALRPYIALPLAASPQEVLQALTHEICHYQSKDHWRAAARLCCCAAHWFNPLVWLAASLSRVDAELRCDDRAAGPMDKAGRRAYAEALIAAASRRASPGLTVLAPGMTMTGKRLKSRVRGIMAEEGPNRGLALAFMALAALLLIGAFATAEYSVPLADVIPNGVGCLFFRWQA